MRGFISGCFAAVLNVSLDYVTYSVVDNGIHSVVEHGGDTSQFLNVSPI